MTSKYLFVDSTYRNRNLYPKASNFEIQLSQSGTKGRFTAVDPVADSSPILVFTTAFDANTGNQTLSAGGVVISTPVATPNIGNATNSISIVLGFTAGHLNQTVDYYNGASVYIAAASPTLNRIVSYRYLNTSGGLDRGLFTVESSYSLIANGDAVNIVNPSDISDTSNPLLFVPSGSMFPNFYISDIIYNQTRNNYTTVKYYYGPTRILQGNSIAGLGWTITDTYVIRKAAPEAIGTITAGTTTSITTLTSTLSPTLPLVGSFIRMTSGAANNQVSRIYSYDDTTIPGSVIVSVYPAFTASPAAADTFEFLQFTRDNSNPLVYSGSTVSSMELCCYNISLIDITIPNRILNTGYGGILSVYPYILVELQNVSSPSSGTSNVIYSNNPYTKSTLFKVAIVDLNRTEITPFIKIVASSPVQTVKFKPNDNLRFSIKLPTGEDLTTIDPEYYSPNSPNPMSQITALFQLVRIEPECCIDSSINNPQNITFPI